MHEGNAAIVGADTSWRPLYVFGGAYALIFSLMCLVPIVLVFTAPRVPQTGAEVLDYIASHKTVYLIQYVCFVGLSLPALVVFFAAAVSLKGRMSSLLVVRFMLPPDRRLRDREP